MENFNTVGFITVRSSSTRLPNKCFLEFGNEETVLSHVVMRCIYYGIEPIVCTSSDESDNPIEALAKKMNVKFFRGSLNNKLKRWLDCANYFSIKNFHTIDADDPFFDGDQMKDSMNLLIDNDYDCVCPTKSSSEGDASVGYSLTKEIIQRALDGVEENTDTEMMWYFVEKVPNIKIYHMKNNSGFKHPIRLTLDFEEDYWLLSFIQRMLGTYATRDEINKLFLLNPDLAKINLFRNDEWKAAQLSKKI